LGVYKVSEGQIRDETSGLVLGSTMNATRFAVVPDGPILNFSDKVVKLIHISMMMIPPVFPTELVSKWKNVAVMAKFEAESSADEIGVCFKCIQLAFLKLHDDGFR
jgi:hypothetical protein